MARPSRNVIQCVVVRLKRGESVERIAADMRLRPATVRKFWRTETTLPIPFGDSARGKADPRNEARGAGANGAGRRARRSREVVRAAPRDLAEMVEQSRRSNEVGLGDVVEGLAIVGRLAERLRAPVP